MDLEIRRSESRVSFVGNVSKTTLDKWHHTHTHTEFFFFPFYLMGSLCDSDEMLIVFCVCVVTAGVRQSSNENHNYLGKLSQSNDGRNEAGRSRECRNNTVCSFLTRLSDTQHTTHSTYHRRCVCKRLLFSDFSNGKARWRAWRHVSSSIPPLFTFFQMNGNAPNRVTTDSSTSPCFSITLNANKSHSSILEKN